MPKDTISLHCSNQPGNLLSAFIRAEGFFLVEHPNF